MGKRGEQIYVIDRHIVPSRLADVSTAHCHLADGVLTITMQRKMSKRIPVHIEAAAANIEPVQEDEPCSSSATVDEWVPPKAERRVSAREREVERASEQRRSRARAKIEGK